MRRCRTTWDEKVQGLANIIATDLKIDSNELAEAIMKEIR